MIAIEAPDDENIKVWKKIDSDKIFSQSKIVPTEFIRDSSWEIMGYLKHPV